jgi:hypothetical protein
MIPPFCKAAGQRRPLCDHSCPSISKDILPRLRAVIWQRMTGSCTGAQRGCVSSRTDTSHWRSSMQPSGVIFIFVLSYYELGWLRSIGNLSSNVSSLFHTSLSLPFLYSTLACPSYAPYSYDSLPRGRTRQLITHRMVFQSLVHQDDERVRV